MDLELDQFKREIDLTVFASSKGYVLDKRESSANCRVLRHAGTDDKIIVGKASDGHWQYFSVRNRHDNGTVIDFVQKREHKALGDVRRELRDWMHHPGNVGNVRSVVPVQPIARDRARIALAVAAAQSVPTHPYLEARGLSADTLAHPRFRGTWKEAAGSYGNVIFLHHDQDGLSGFEVKNWGFTRFAKGGQRGLWRSLSFPDDMRLVVTESAIDALSFHQLDPNPKARYVSLAGEISSSQEALLARSMQAMQPGGVVVAATDKDKAGHRFAHRLEALAHEHRVGFERATPAMGKDWNEHLQATRALGRSDALELHKKAGIQR
jgi:hypothetical protein